MKGIRGIGAALRAAFLPPAAGIPPQPKSRSFSEAVNRLTTEASGLVRDVQGDDALGDIMNDFVRRQ